MFTYTNFNDMWLIDVTKSKSYNKIAKMRNQHVFMNEFMHEVDMFMYAFRIDGMPDTGSERAAKEAILWYGGYVPFEEGGSVLTLPGLPNGDGLNMYADYAGATVFGADGFNEQIPLLLPGADKARALAHTIGGGERYKEPRGVLVRANAQMYPFINYLYYFAEAIADTMRSLDVCRQHIKRPFVITAKKAMIPTIEEQDRQVQDNQPFVINTGTFPVDSIQFTPITGIPECIQAASQLIDWYKQQYRELIGYDNLGGQIDKKGENLITPEVTYNQEATDASLGSLLYWLNIGHEAANKLLGTNLKAVQNVGNNDTGRDEEQRGGDLPGQNAGDAESND